MGLKRAVYKTLTIEVPKKIEQNSKLTLKNETDYASRRLQLGILFAFTSWSFMLSNP